MVRCSTLDIYANRWDDAVTKATRTSGRKPAKKGAGYFSINRFQERLIPIVHDNGFDLTETNAIFMICERAVTKHVAEHGPSHH